MSREDHHLEPLVADPASERTVAERSTVAWIVVPVFVAAFLGTTALLVPPHSADDILRAKRAHLAAHADEYDGVFLGSSRIHRAFDPATFEELTGKRVFNFGLLYGRPHELDTLAEELLAEHRFEFVLVEVMDWHPSLNPDLEDQDRTIRWHTPRQTWSAIRTTWTADGTKLGRSWRTGKHLGHLVKNAANFGGGPIRLRSWFDDTRHRDWRDVVAEGDGWIRYEQETDPRYARERRAFLEKYEPEYRRQVARVDAANAEPGSLAGFNVAAQREQTAMIERFGAEAIHVVPNLRRGTSGWHRLEAEGAVATLITLNHVDRYPELYAVENRFDRRHLNTAGARHFTRRLAESFLERRATR